MTLSQLGQTTSRRIDHFWNSAFPLQKVKSRVGHFPNSESGLVPRFTASIGHFLNTSVASLKMYFWERDGLRWWVRSLGFRR